MKELIIIFFSRSPICLANRFRELQDGYLAVNVVDCSIFHMTDDTPQHHLAPSTLLHDMPPKYSALSELL